MSKGVMIRELMAELWPAVREGMAEQIRRNGGRQVANFRRRLVEQTLWELDRKGKLLTPEHEELIKEAKKWREAWGPDPISSEEEDVTEEDVLLYHAVSQLP